MFPRLRGDTCPPLFSLSSDEKFKPRPLALLLIAERNPPGVSRRGQNFWLLAGPKHPPGVGWGVPPTRHLGAAGGLPGARA